MRYLLSFILFVASVHAAPLTPADRDAVRQQQEQILRKGQQQRDELERSAPLPRAGVSAPSAVTLGPCFTLHTITLSGATLIHPKARQQLLSPWQGRCLDMAKITPLTSSISDWYISRGYITSRAYLTDQDLSQGELRIVVLEGRLRQIRLEGASPRMLKMVFPGLEGSILNLRDIEQGMEQINRLRTVPVQFEIIPDTEASYSIVDLKAALEFTLSVSLSLDNSGQKSTGEDQLSGTLIGNNLLGLSPLTYSG